MRHYLITVAAVMLLATGYPSTSWQTVSAGDDVLPTLEEMSEAMLVAHEQRYRLLTRSRGKAYFLKNKTAQETFEQVRQRAAKEMGLAPDQFKMSWSEEWTVTWQQRDDLRRFDVFTPSMNEHGQPLNIMDMRYVTGGPVNLQYDAHTSEAQITRASQMRSINPGGFHRSFDVRWLYDYKHHTVRHPLNPDREPPQLAWDEVDGKPCVRVEYRFVRDGRPGGIGRHIVSVLRFWHAPDMAYAMVKVESHTEIYEGEKLARRAFGGSFEAEYEEAAEHPGVWFLRQATYKIAIPQVGLFYEEVRVRIVEQEVDVDVPDEVFTLAGIGASHGDIILDSRERFSHVAYTFGPDFRLEDLPGAEPSRIDLARKLIDRLMHDRPDAVAELFDATMKEAMPVEKIAALRAEVLAVHGQYQDFGRARGRREQGFDVIYLGMIHEESRLTWKIVFDAAGEVSGLWLVEAVPHEGEAERMERARQLVDDMMHNRLDVVREQLGDDLKFTLDHLVALRNRPDASFDIGEFKELGEIRTRREQGLNVAFVSVLHQHGRRDWKVVFDENNEVRGFRPSGGIRDEPRNEP